MARSTSSITGTRRPACNCRFIHNPFRNDSKMPARSVVPDRVE